MLGANALIHSDAVPGGAGGSAAAAALRTVRWLCGAARKGFLLQAEAAGLFLVFIQK